MLSRFATVIHNAVDALAPPVPLQEELVYHWNAITSFFIDKHSDSTAPVEQTNIPGHLQQMLQVLIEEEDDTEQGSTGPCMEYVLHHKLLDTLQTLGRADCPPGMKQQVLMFFSQLLTKLKQPFLAHISVYRPVQRLIKMCGEVKAAPTELEEVHFLCIVCAKLKDAPHLVSFFLEDKTPTPKTSEPESELPASSAVAQTRIFDFPLVNSLLILCQSADNHITVKACEGLLLSSSLSDDLCASSIIENTALCDTLVQRLIQMYQNLPCSVDPSLIEVVEAKWGLDTFDFNEDILMFPGKRQLVIFLSWIDFCDQLIKEAHPAIGSALAEIIHKEWWLKIVQPALLQTSEEEVILTTAYVTRCLHSISSKQLLTEFAVFLLGENKEAEIPGIHLHHLKKTLLENCNCSSDELNALTLKLFETLLERNNEYILHNLILANIISRDYYDNTLVDYQESWSDEEDSRLRQGCYDLEISPGSSPISRTLAPTNIHKIINCFLLLLPDELKSSDNEEDTGYENYLHDAHQHFRDCAMACSTFDWPREAITKEEQNISDCSSSESQAEADSASSFYEGSFLNMIFNKLEAMLDQPYGINLQVTSIIAKLALFPHPYLHEFLLNPLIPQVEGARTLFAVLEKIVNSINSRIHEVPNFKRKLFLTRKQLLSDSKDYNRCTEEGGILEGIIVLEEFCKELAAIAFVKYHASS
uniref:Protein FAM160B1 n=1 Tax=Hemiscolopendra marginata TaxID=943146 RepID=A0A646QEG9_9MYRI